MENRNFDNLTKLLASGKSRRSILKGFLGIGGTTVASSVAVNVADARRSSGRRTTPPPTTPPPSCSSGNQPCDSNSTGCCAICEPGMTVCGYDCCDDLAQCCDGECCSTGSTCVGEETCCPNTQLCYGAPGSCCDIDQKCCDGACIDQNACCQSQDCSSAQVCCTETGPCGLADYDQSNACATDDDCCSGICQSGLCVPTIGGVCSPGASICSGSEATQCGTNCSCAVSVTGGSVCGFFSTCQQSCDQCSEGTICVEAAGCCTDGASFLCATPCPPEGGDCFTGDTCITMADGSTRPISDLQIGDTVLGADGVINTVSAIRALQLGDRPLYSFNESDYFVTESHPFMTTTGWKSINPEVTRQTIRDLNVNTLKVGDQIQKLAGILVASGSDMSQRGESFEIDMCTESIQRINSMSAAPETLIYTISLSGNQSYFANGLLVHNKP